MKKSVIFFLPAILFLISPPQTRGQDIQSDASGLYANLNLHFGQWYTSSSFLEGLRAEEPNGWGLQLSAGYGFNQRMEAFLHFSHSNFNMSGDWNTYNHNEIGIGFRYNFGATLSKIRPFLDLQANSSSLEIDRIFFIDPVFGRVEGDLQMSGYSFILGGGARYFIRPWIAAKLHARFHYGTDYEQKLAGFELTFPDDQDISQFDVGIGITWYFGSGFE